MRQFCGYGLVHSSQAREFAVAVCDVLGHGGNAVAVRLLLETAAQETHVGQFRDPSPDGAGRGLCQVDAIAFVDVIQRTPEKDFALIKAAFGIDMRQVDHDDLDFSPLLSFIVCRLFYKRIPEAIPAAIDARGAYWKKYYNTYLGKGSVGEYVDNALRFL